MSRISRPIDCVCSHPVDYHTYSKGRCPICTCPKADAMMTQAEWRKTPEYQTDMCRARLEGAEDEHQYLLSQFLLSGGREDT